VKIIVDLNFNLKHPDGKEVEPAQTAAGVLSGVIAASNTKQPLKFWNWAEALAKNNNVEIDEADFQLLLTFVEDSTTMTNIVRGPVLKALLDAKHAAA